MIGDAGFAAVSLIDRLKSVSSAGWGISDETTQFAAREKCGRDPADGNFDIRHANQLRQISIFETGQLRNFILTDAEDDVTRGPVNAEQDTDPNASQLNLTQTLDRLDDRRMS